MKDLKITLVQSGLEWEAAQSNIEHFTKLLSGIRKSSTHLVILPEMFSTGFSMNASMLAESMNGITVNWMKAMSAKLNAIICGSIIIKEKNKFFNRLLWVTPDGSVMHYDKRHLFRMAKEDQTYTAGKQKLHVEINGWKIVPLVCYDLRFPVWSRTDGTTDLMLFVANWPEKRAYAWKQLLIARAIENQCFVAGLNRVGVDGKGIHYSGDSVVLDPLGVPVKNIPLNTEVVTTVTLSYKVLSNLRKIFPVRLDSDAFKITN
jgi:omega-amidase